MRMRMAAFGALFATVAGVACAPPGAPAGATTPTPSAGAIAAFIPTAERFVEQHRGLKFKQKVQVQYLDDAAFTARVQSDNHDDPKGTAQDSKELRALHLIPAGTDLQHAEDELLGAGVLGFYDPKTKALVVRGGSDSPETRHVVVHELTHALQDQWFSLDRLDSNDPSAESDAYRALVEGDARRVEDEYLATLSAQQRRQAEGSGGTLPADVPVALAEILSFPYQVGPPFTAALLRSGGQKRLDAAFGAGVPRYTAEVIHPDRYLSGFQAAKVDAPAPAGAEFDRGIFGEEDLVYVLERAPSRPSATTVRDVAAGWRGDAYVAYDTPAGSSCLGVGMAMDSAAHAQQLAALLRPAAGYRVDSVSGSTVTWTACAAA
jgi:hypothetical protein